MGSALKKINSKEKHLNKVLGASHPCPIQWLKQSACLLSRVQGDDEFAAKG